MRTTDMQLVLDTDVRAAIQASGAPLVGYKVLRDKQRELAGD